MSKGLFNGEFYRLADELAAELERVKARWGAEIVRYRPPRVYLFRGITLPAGANITGMTFSYWTRWSGADEDGAPVTVEPPPVATMTWERPDTVAVTIRHPSI